METSSDDALDVDVGDARDASERALEALQWADVRAQAAAFAWTTRGRRALRRATLAVSVREAEAALARTAALRTREGLDGKDFDGARDALGAVEGAMGGRTLSARALGALGSTGRTQRRLGEALRATDDARLRDIERALSATPSEVVDAIERCLGIPGGEVLDDASPWLREIRNEQRSVRDALRDLLNETSREMARKNFAERAQVVTRLGRQCIPMKLGSAGELPGVVLDVSGTGNTVFKEPQSAVPLNNTLATLAAQEDEEIERILIELTAIVAKHADAFLAANEALTELDVANARARHATWLDASAPTIVSSDRGIRVRELQHPLLLQKHLPPLPRTMPVDAEDIVSAFGTPIDAGDAEDEDEGEDATASAPVLSRYDVADLVVPVDFNVDESIRCVAITGPNTGGKTASLKAIGVACLMARAGMYVPCAPGCEIPFFKEIVVDLGDSQSLQLDGGLSTFGAHLKSLQRILNAASEDTLVLLDEPGSGTDPAEGAALAVAVLNKLSRQSRLTVATSHYEKVKEFALASDVAQVAAVEFDLKTLQPTYRLLWGETGKSNALYIAAGLGLSPSIIAEARDALAKADASTETDASGIIARENRAKLASALDKECEVQIARRVEASYGLQEARALFDEVKSESAHLDLRKQIIKSDIDAEVASKIEEARELFAACETIEEVEEIARAHLPKGWVIGANGEAVPEDAAAEGASMRWIPTVGDLVVVRQLGTAEAEVIDVHPDSNEITVKLGRISTRVSLASGVSKVDTSKKSWR